MACQWIGQSGSLELPLKPLSQRSKSSSIAIKFHDDKGLLVHRDIELKAVAISKATRFKLTIMRWFAKPIIRCLAFLPWHFTITGQLKIAGKLRRSASGVRLDYDVLPGTIGYLFGDWSAYRNNNQKPPSEAPPQRVLLYLHGGAFFIPAVPGAHLNFIAKTSRDLGALAFAPDYRLAPFHRYPAALDDCEQAYRTLLNMGVPADHISVAGDSAGGNLVLGLLQRIRSNNLPMPSCAALLSPVTEIARVYAPPSRIDNARKDPFIPVGAFSKMLIRYAADANGADPELSPIFADFTGFPPLYFLVSENEILLDDTLIAARRAEEDGVEVKLDIWPYLQHAFPVMERLTPEAAIARRDIADFMRQHLPESENTY